MQLLINGLIAGSLAALIAGGLALVYGVLGVFNVALGQMVLFGGYISWWLYASGLPLWLSLFGGLVFGGLLSWFTFAVFVRPFYRYHRFLPLVTTIAWSMMLDGLLLLIFDARPVRILQDSLLEPTTIAGATINTVQIGLIVVTVFLLVLCAYILHSTALGRRIRAVVQHHHAAMSLGIPAGMLSCGLFVASGVLAAAGGIFLGMDQNLTPTFGFPITIKAYAAVIAGGKGNVWGAVLCAYIIALLEQLAIGVHWFGLFYISPGFQSTVALLVIIAFLLLKPQGIFGARLRTA